MSHTKRITRIDPMSVGKILGLFYLILGGIVGSVFGMIMLASLVVNPDASETGMMFGMGLGMIVFVTAFYGLMGLVFGMLGSYLYNLLASWVGGIKVETK